MADAATVNHKRSFTDFIEQWGYHEKIQQLIDASQHGKSPRLMLDLDDLRAWDEELKKNFMRRPAEYLPAFEEALRDAINGIDPLMAKNVEKNIYRIGVTGTFGSHHVSPRGLGAELLNCVVHVEGIVTKCSIVRPKIVKSAHYCPATKQTSYKDYRDLTSLTGLATGSAYPTKDANGNALETEVGLCEYMDYQTVTLQEMPERAPPGQLPRSVDVILEADLVDQAKPGDRLQISGIYRALPSKANSSGMFRTIVLGNHVRQVKSVFGSEALTEDDVETIRELAKQKNVFDLLAESLAPSVFGHSAEKSALLLMLLGGAERNLENGTHLRGDINLLMLGDPSTAKSQLLRSVLRTAPLAISTTGRGSSGVGLTAAVTTDAETGGKRLEAGAMVLADRGVCCVDEFDKMLDADRVAIHEVMEQQTVTISKAGIHASLNARCAVVAAANPIFGSYNANYPPMWNIAMPDSLLSRFDLLFIILDKKEPESDRRICEHVLRQHRRRDVVRSNGMSGVNEAEANSDKAVTSEVFVKRTEGQDEDRVSAGFLRKYINYAKQKCPTPQLSESAATHISKEYADLRKYQSGIAGRTLPVTARTLETMIRLSSAHAKVHLRNLVTKEDADYGVGLLKSVLLSSDELMKKAKGSQESDRDDDKPDAPSGGGGGGDGSDNDDDDNDSDDGAEQYQGGPSSTRPGKRPAAEQSGEGSPAEDEAEAPASQQKRPRTVEGSAGSSKVSPEMEHDMKLFEVAMAKICPPGEEQCEVETLHAELKTVIPRFSNKRLQALLNHLEVVENKIMHRDSTIYVI